MRCPERQQNRVRSRSFGLSEPQRQARRHRGEERGEYEFDAAEATQIDGREARSDCVNGLRKICRVQARRGELGAHCVGDRGGIAASACQHDVGRGIAGLRRDISRIGDEKAVVRRRREFLDDPRPEPHST